ncbi:YidH family protein [Acidimangrovimonas pyrenivorans]|uniref:YidH family protein n=1 Tax=Acidimangrovimonas pyrenivorans TaxID=2030798 RepID=A0ABV7AHJ4_9RHOB
MTDFDSMKTEWAEERTVLAVERTYASWLRTGLGAIGVAIGLHVVFGLGPHGWAGRAVASLFLVIALTLFAAAERQAQRQLRQLAEEYPLPHRGRFTSISLLFIVATLAVGVLLWSL